MPQSLAKVFVHIIFSTKERFPVLSNEIRSDVNAYLAAILSERDSPAIIVNSTPDHVHILCSLSRTFSISDIVEEVKTGSSKWLKTKSPKLRGFQWQAGYAAFSVSSSNVAAVRRYIENQETHHRRRTFQDELRRFLARHEIAYDERYLWA